MENVNSDMAQSERAGNELALSQAVAQLLQRDLAPIGDVTLEPRLRGIALLEDGVMFGYVDADGTPYLRGTAHIAQQFHALGSRKHPEMRYWTIPNSIAANVSLLRDVAYEAADTAHLALSFGIDDDETTSLTKAQPVRSLLAMALLAA